MSARRTALNHGTPPGRMWACVVALLYLIGPFQAHFCLADCDDGCACCPESPVAGSEPSCCGDPAPAEPASPPPLSAESLAPDCCIHIDSDLEAAPLPAPDPTVMPLTPVLHLIKDHHPVAPPTWAHGFKTRTGLSPPGRSAPLYLLCETLMR